MTLLIATSRHRQGFRQIGHEPKLRADNYF